MLNKLDPRPFEVDAALEAIEWEEEKQRTRKALAYINGREKPGMFISGWDALKFFGKIVCIVGVIWLLVRAVFSL